MFYVARIKEGENSPMDPRCIAKAIQYSVETWDVHIISMSWGFKNEHSCISDDIRLAHARDKIMFAAASNEGANLPAGLGATFPASMREVICINSSDGYGNQSDLNPPARNGDFNFSTLGEAVLASSSSSELTRQTGSSFATPIAATIVALLLEFIMQKQIFRADTKLKQQAATKDGVTKLLHAIGNPVSGFRYLKPWDLIQCQGLTNSCPCKDCRKAAENKIRAPLSPLCPDSLPGAAFDASNKQHTSFCLPNTRVDILAQIHKWADEGDTRQVYWLKGMAGTGKTTIALTLAREYHAKGRLGGSFFYSRGGGDLALSRRFVATIALQLAECSPELRVRIKDAVDANPNISTKMSQNSLLIVVDALDECEGDDDVRLLIRCLTAIGDLPLQDEHRYFILHDIETSIVDRDLAEFYRHELEEIDRLFGLENLLSEHTINHLVQQSSELFIYAATVCRLIRQKKHHGARCLSNLIKAKGLPPGTMQKLDKLYMMILQNAANSELDPDESRDELEAFRRLVGALVVLFDTFSLTNICILLNETNIAPTLGNLQSILNIPEQPSKPINLLHPSFRDFLLDESR
ncbi:hypothetical protein NM208_g3244 [Fusarium decemcellulare]|uniref:Uncharacterized protein n=1 Tax=Fusarium decemcellulare TaxID=57161 RepID=A0ACC1SPX1_9HYPO|nr:hypothetical protein NM208_g3244 [Fusarium decemcellulare]